MIETTVLSDGYLCHVRWWKVANPRGAVLYLHGIQSHGGWYEESGRRLAAAGFTVLMPDRRGSGLNQVDRGHAESADRLIEDADAHLTALLEAAGGRSAHLAGVSWGGKLVTVMAAEQPDRVASLSLIAPGIFARVDLTMPEKFRVAMSFINDRTRRFDIPLNDPQLFTSNPSRIDYVNADPLKLTRVSATFLLASRRLDRRAVALDRSKFSGPIHLHLAEVDRIIDNQRTAAWLQRLPNTNISITTYPGAKHTIEFEADPEPFFRTMVSWISQQQP